ncbi:MAG: response regulator [Alphaproteobacteria bacterium]|jgi:CheY-like chemotaxis protein
MQVWGEAMAQILVAEDEPTVRAFIARALTLSGYETVVTEDGQRALEALATQSFDLLLSDIQMPEVDGITLALKASQEWPDMPILLMSGYAQERQRAHNLDVLAQAVLTKPFDLATLRETVAAALAGDSDAALRRRH